LNSTGGNFHLGNRKNQRHRRIDTHADTHHVAIINGHGKPLADKEFLAVGSGYRKIVEFITAQSPP
jgi:hypothetical protein